MLSICKAQLLLGCQSAVLEQACGLQAAAPPEDLTGMAGRSPDPAALLSVYLQYDRLTDAADLVLSHFAGYQKVCYVIVYSSVL